MFNMIIFPKLTIICTTTVNDNYAIIASIWMQPPATTKISPGNYYDTCLMVCMSQSMGHIRRI